MDPSVFEKLISYHWPGNVRELANTINRSLILCKGEVITAEDIIFDIEGEAASSLMKKSWKIPWQKCSIPFLPIFSGTGEKASTRICWKKLRKFLIRKALAETKGNQVQAAKLWASVAIRCGIE